MSALCINCGSEFDTMLQLQDHIKTIHSAGRRSDFKVSKEKAPTVQEVSKKEEPQKESPHGIDPPPIKKERKPIELIYQYIGQCDMCGVPVETHEIKVKEGLYMIAWCSSCRKQLKDIKVIPIKEQL